MCLCGEADTNSRARELPCMDSQLIIIMINIVLVGPAPLPYEGGGGYIYRWRGVERDEWMVAFSGGRMCLLSLHARDLIFLSGIDA